jgi:methyltransferase (TIGR00027 family)
MNLPSTTSQVVALTRAELDRPHSAEGDPDAQRWLCQDMTFSPPAWLRPSIAARTSFVDGEVMTAIASGIRQIVICGAGYDDRALRFRTAGVRFFELDHPSTQADKARLLGEFEAGKEVMLAAADFRADDTGAVLDRAGHDAGKATLFICEGLLVYLDLATCRRLLAALAGRAAAGSVLAASLSTHADGLDTAEAVAAANARRRNSAAEPWLTILPRAEYLALLEQAGWEVATTQLAPSSYPDVGHDRRSLLVSARRRAGD